MATVGETIMRTATFTLTDGDDEAQWNGFVDELYRLGLRPADEPIRFSGDTATYRVFAVDQPARKRRPVFAPRFVEAVGVGMLGLTLWLGAAAHVTAGVLA